MSYVLPDFGLIHVIVEVGRLLVSIFLPAVVFSNDGEIHLIENMLLWYTDLILTNNMSCTYGKLFITIDTGLD